MEEGRVTHRASEHTRLTKGWVAPSPKRTRASREAASFEIEKGVHTMNQHDINRIYTEKVAELLARGYQIHTGTMSGSEGEIAHTDFYKGSEILRLLLTRDRDFRAAYGDIYQIEVGRRTEKPRGAWDDVIWNNRLETLSQIKLVKITDTYFCTPEEAEGMSEKRMARWLAKEAPRTELGDAYKSAALGWLRKQPRMRTCKLSEIESMARTTDGKGRTRYEIKARGNRYTIGSGRA